MGHTAGPLALRRASRNLPPETRGDVGIVAEIDGEERLIGEAYCRAVGSDSEAPEAPALANARLWAASPDLLAVAKRLVGHLDGPALHKLVRDAEAAIAKATGG